MSSADSAGNISRHRKLGELTENIRTFALPFESRTYTFKMQYAYDSYNRIQRITYPDGEVVSYEYNLGGMLNKVFGSVTRNLWEMTEPVRAQGMSDEPSGRAGGGSDTLSPPSGPDDPQTITYHYPYIDSVVYNVFELKDSVVYGNGTRVRYEYDSLLRLSRLRSYAASGTKMQDITYTYDSAGNITHIFNSAGSVSGLGGRYEGNYTYDDLYRLTAAHGWWKNKTDSLPFSETMTYAPNGRLTTKTVGAATLVGNQVSARSGDFRYSYAGRDNRVSSVTDRTGQNARQTFRWDACGNMTECITESSTASWHRTLAWDEDNRLRTVADQNHYSYYQYDASGERTCKLTWSGTWSNINGTGTVYYLPEGGTLYASPYLVVTPQGYTKHYYAEAERITSQLGRGQFADVGTPVVSDSLVQVKLQAVTGNVEYPATLTVPGSGAFAYLDTLTNRQDAVSTLYFYHPDHLGSSSWITTTNGAAVQHLHYLPWGEDFVDRRTTNWSALYTFSAKERDVETGLSYFGSRYYSSDLSIWLSVDPMSDKYPSTSPYAYCRNNPIILYDPNGMFDDWVMNKNGHIYWDENAINQETTKQGETYLGKEGQHTIGTEVWNYHRDKTFDEQKPVIINGNSQCDIDQNANTSLSQNHNQIDQIDNIISATSLATTLPIGAAAESVVKTSSKIALKGLGGTISAVTVIPDIVRWRREPTVENKRKVFVSAGGALISLIPVIGPVGSVIWSSIDAGGGFDRYYKKEKK